jgi:hypothetical protein
MRIKVLQLCFTVGMLAGCSESAPAPTEALSASAVLFSSHSLNRNHATHLRGSEEVPPADTRAQGQIKVQVSKDGSSLEYRLIVANIQNVTMAHFHLAPAGVNGPVVAWLYPSSPPAQLIPGRSSGPLAEGEITAANLVGPLAGQNLSALIEAIQAGDIYVNVHTSQFPGGEVRGQFR